MSNIRCERMYYAESDLFEFTATVVECVEKGDEIYIRLDKSAFYPTSGGQPHDTGWLNTTCVREVIIQNDHVYHVVNGPIPIGEQITGRIDVPRRLDHMEQHAGQHIVSACFEQMLDIDTVGFHMGEEFVTIDLNITQLDESQIWDVEQKANQVVLEDRKITPFFASDEELTKLGLRHPPKVTNEVRIVTIEGFDHNPCGGTHPSSTGKVGQIKFLKVEKVRNQQRLFFVCGNRALREHDKSWFVVRDLNQMLSATTDELVDAIKKMSAEMHKNKKAMNELQVRLARMEASRLFEMVKPTFIHSNQLVACSIIPDADNSNYLKMVLQAFQEISQANSFAISLIAPIGNRIYIQCVCAGISLPANKWIQNTITEFGGKGGGNDIMAQGSISVPDSTPDGGPALAEKVKQALEYQFTHLN